MKVTCNIGLSSMALWLYPNGNMDKKPIRARSDAGGDVFSGKVRKIKNKFGEYQGEEFSYAPVNYLEYSDKHVIKIRSGWDGFADEKAYGPIVIKQTQSPIANR